MTFAHLTQVLSNRTVWEARVGRVLLRQDADPGHHDATGGGEQFHGERKLVVEPVGRRQHGGAFENQGAATNVERVHEARSAWLR